MDVDIGSLSFNATILSGGGTPSWGTSLGQSAPDYKLTYPGSAEILVAMDYCYHPLSNRVSCKLGKGGHEYKAIQSQASDSKYEIVKAAIFYKVSLKIGTRKIPINKPMALLVTKENENIHRGRRTLKYSDSIVVGNIKNDDFYIAASSVLGHQSCWFAYAINVENQDELVISVVKVSDVPQTYLNSDDRVKKWRSLLPNR